MKKSLTVILLTLANALFAQSLVQVYNDGRLFYPENFFEKNDVATKTWVAQKADEAKSGFDRDIRLYVDMTPTAGLTQKDINGDYSMRYWSDCEIKAIDNRTNAILYFTSTIALNNSQVAKLHPSITDKGVRIWYRTVFGGSGCYGDINELTDFDSCIYYEADNKVPITGVWVYPNLEKKILWNGKHVSVREILTHPDVTVLAWRQNPTESEKYNNQKVWRPVRVERYGEMHQVPNYIPQNNAFVSTTDNVFNADAVGIYQSTENNGCPLYYLNDQLVFTAGQDCPYSYILYFRYGANFNKQSSKRLVLEFESDTATWHTKSTAARTITITSGTGKGTVLWTKPEDSPNTATSARKFYLALDGSSSVVEISGPFLKGEVFRMPKFRTYLEE